MKKIIVIAGLVLLAAACQKKVKNEEAQSYPATQRMASYYDQLISQCKGDTCCTVSVYTMMQKNFKLADSNNKCPEGFKANKGQCPGSYVWCERTYVEASSSEQAIPPGNFELKNGKIYWYMYSNPQPVERGSYSNGLITIKMRGYTISFPGDVKKLEFFPVMDTDSFTYDGVDFSHYLGVGNSVDQPDAIKYDCKQAIAPITQNKNFHYCQTNFKDTQNDFEYTYYNSFGFGTGGGTGINWKKIYVKDYKPTPLYLVANLKDPESSGLMDSDVYEMQENCGDDQGCISRQKEITAKFNNMASSRHLDTLLQIQENKDLIRKAEQIFESIKLSPGGLDLIKQ